MKSIRITASVANWGVRLPAIAALLLTQGSLLASQVSLPMLAPLLLGTGAAASRCCLVVVASCGHAAAVRPGTLHDVDACTCDAELR